MTYLPIRRRAVLLAVSLRIPAAHRLCFVPAEFGGGPRVLRQIDRPLGRAPVRLQVPVGRRQLLVAKEVRDPGQRRARIREVGPAPVTKIVRRKLAPELLAEHGFRGALQVLGEVMASEDQALGRSELLEQRDGALRQRDHSPKTVLVVVVVDAQNNSPAAPILGHRQRGERRRPKPALPRELEPPPKRPLAAVNAFGKGRQPREDRRGLRAHNLDRLLSLRPRSTAGRFRRRARHLWGGLEIALLDTPAEKGAQVTRLAKHGRAAHTT
jgi:hypothetical protein